jgi:hypothetical protein
MTRGLTRQNPVNSKDKKNDDWWDEIKGIGAKRAKWLEDEFNVVGLEDFVALAVDEIDSRVKDKNNISWRRDEIEKSHEIACSRFNSPARDAEWEYIAAFVLEFKARKVEGVEEAQEINVRPVEITKDGTWGDVTDEKPTVVEGERLYRWMQEQVVVKAPLEPEKVPQIEPEEEPPAEEEPAEVPSVMVEIKRVQAFQPPQAKTPAVIAEAAKPFQGFLGGDEPFDLQVSFNLVGPGAKAIAQKQIPYRAHFFSRELPIGERAVLGATEPDTLAENQTSYTVKLPEVFLSPGRYRFRVLVRLLSTPPIGDYLEVPLLKVV